MKNHEQCERCDGTGADPMQHSGDEEVRLCVECFGDGYIEVYAVTGGAIVVEEYQLPLSA